MLTLKNRSKEQQSERFLPLTYILPLLTMALKGKYIETGIKGLKAVIYGLSSGIPALQR